MQQNGMQQDFSWERSALAYAQLYIQSREKSMKTRAIILAGGEGTRLGVLTAKRTKPAVPFAGKYRIIDFPLSNCVNSNLFDVMIIAQYRPQSLIEHIGAGGPWDLDRDFTGGLAHLHPLQITRGRLVYWHSRCRAAKFHFYQIRSSGPDP
jgi:glucose-1-phosphate adenylyltransferase